MAILDFPDAPILDQVWDAPSGSSYRFDGVVWVSLSGGGGGGGGTAPPPGGALVTVTHDLTLAGEGTTGYPLAVAVALDSGVY